jgi:hypothetical protein
MTVLVLSPRSLISRCDDLEDGREDEVRDEAADDDAEPDLRLPEGIVAAIGGGGGIGTEETLPDPADMLELDETCLELIAEGDTRGVGENARAPVLPPTGDKPPFRLPGRLLSVRLSDRLSLRLSLLLSARLSVLLPLRRRWASRLARADDCDSLLDIADDK